MATTKKAVRKTVKKSSKKGEQRVVPATDITILPPADAIDRKRDRYTKRSRETRHLKCVLSREEVEERSSQAAQAWAEKEKLEQEIDGLKQSFKGRISQFESKHSQLQREVLNRCTYRDVTCEETFYFDLGEAIVRRTDTWEEVERRELTDEERQMDLDLPRAVREERIVVSDDGTAVTIPNRAKEDLDEEGDRTNSALKARAKNQRGSRKQEILDGFEGE